MELARKAVNTWPEAKPWLDADDIAHLVEKVGRACQGRWQTWRDGSESITLSPLCVHSVDP